MDWQWVDGDGASQLVDDKGRNRAAVWANGTWHTWDEDGCGGENSREESVFAAKGAAMGSVVLQGWAKLVSPDALLSQAGKALSRRGSAAGGRARAEALSPERRKEIAKIAARARWSRRETA